MAIVFRVLSILIAFVFFMTAANWIFDPTEAAKSLGMDLLTGMGASTQIGDISAFFLSVSLCMIAGQRRGQSHWFYPAALLFGAAALMRTLAFVSGNAPFGTEFIVPEVVLAIVIVLAARNRADESSEPAGESQ